MEHSHLFGGPEENNLKEPSPKDTKKVDDFSKEKGLKMDSYKELSEDATLKNVQKTELRDSKDGYYVLNSIINKERFPIGKDTMAEVDSAIRSEENFAEKIFAGGEKSLRNTLALVRNEIRIYEKNLLTIKDELQKIQNAPLNNETQEIINDYNKEYNEYLTELGTLKVQEMRILKEIEKIKTETLGHITAQKAKGPEYLKNNLNEDDFISLN